MKPPIIPANIIDVHTHVLKIRMKFGWKVWIKFEVDMSGDEDQARDSMIVEIFRYP